VLIEPYTPTVGTWSRAHYLPLDLRTRELFWGVGYS
jgi:hypothetical protein